MIKLVQAKNFLSWSELTFDIKAGVTLIDGFNRDDQTSEGSGKSAVLNALSWGLYGKIPKDANIDDVIKTGEKGCIVKLTCDTFTIVRSRNKNELYIETLEGKKTKGKDVRETQKMIEELIGMTFDTFCQTIYFAQNYPKKFITAPQEDKGKILSEVQDLQVFDKARAEVLKLIKKENSTLQQLQMQFQEKNLLCQGANNELDLLKQQAEKDRQYRENQIMQYDNQIAQKTQQVTNLDTEIQNLETTKNSMVSLPAEEVNKLNNEIANFNQAVAAIKHKLTDVDNHNRKYNDLKAEQDKYLREQSRIIAKIDLSETQRKQIQDYILNPDTNCPTCGQEVDAPDMTASETQLKGIIQEIEDYTKDKVKIDELILESGNDLNAFEFSNADELNQDLININQEISNRQRKLTAHNSSISEFSRLTSKIESNKNFIAGLVTDINNINTQKQQFLEQPQTDYSAQINKKQEDADALFAEANQIQSLINIKNIYIGQLESLKGGFKEVKSYTFNSVLAELTVKSNRYLQELFEVPVTIRFTNDNMKIQTSIVHDSVTKGFGLLSGGESTRTTLAVDLALSEIVALRTGSKMNLRILDEYFRFLSEESMEKCLRLLEKLGGSTILIEHNSLFKSIVDQTFFVEKIQGTSRASSN